MVANYVVSWPVDMYMTALVQIRLMRLPFTSRGTPDLLPTHIVRLVDAVSKSYVSSTRNLQTGDDFAGDHATAGSMSSVRTFSRLIWYWRMFHHSAKTARTGYARWHSWAERIRGMRVSSNSSSQDIMVRRLKI